jgi:hypothetical protein
MTLKSYYLFSSFAFLEVDQQTCANSSNCYYTEIVTDGCMYVNQLCDPDLRIWSLSASESANPFEYVVFAIAGIAVAVLVVVVLYFGVKKRT